MRSVHWHTQIQTGHRRCRVLRAHSCKHKAAEAGLVLKNCAVRIGMLWECKQMLWSCLLHALPTQAFLLLA